MPLQSSAVTPILSGTEPVGSSAAGVASFLRGQIVGHKDRAHSPKIPRLHLDPIDMPIWNKDIARRSSERLARIGTSTGFRTIAVSARYRKYRFATADARESGR
ncbi:MAG TPA: hypothetical protein PLX84_12865, partial [Acidiphilium sp.]|nr:hypothetical protein [Acidiphilium sp.]